MAFLSKEKLFSGKWFYSYMLILVGSFIMAAGFVFFISPYKLVPGGVYGIGIVLYHLTEGVIPVGLTGLAFNIPLTIIGIRVLGPRFGVKTVVGFILTSIFIDGLAYFWGNQPLVEDEALLSSIFGGILIGFGLGLIFKAKASSGGSSIMAMLATKVTRVPVGQTLMVIDSVIVLVGLVAFRQWEIPLYSWIVIFITSKVIDITMEGMSYEKTVFIISDRYQEISEKILYDLKRGGTVIEGKGMYNNADKKIIFVNVTRRELSMLTEYVNEIDPKAFLTVIEASEILGQGFKSLEGKVGDAH
ncbi:MAG: YitT family protein [Bacteroidetes bacterium]|nr:MAG: YitT family protein [Bacteroidota bacterium]